MSDTRETGKLGERLAAEYLIKKGFTVVCRNYHSCDGEIDIICENDERVVFVEVKARRSTYYGRPCAAVDLKKQRRFIATAEKYLSENKCEKRIRLDVVEVYLDGRENKIVHLENAFVKR